MLKSILFLALMLLTLKAYTQQDTPFVHLAKDNYQCVYGFKKGNQWVIRPQYAEAGEFYNGLSIVRLENGKYGVVDIYGNVRIEPKYDMLQLSKWLSFNYSFGEKEFIKFNNGKPEAWFVVKMDNCYGLVDQDDKVVIPLEYDYLSGKYTSTKFFLEKDKLIGYGDSTGVHFEPKYCYLSGFGNNGHAVASNTYKPLLNDSLDKLTNSPYETRFCQFGLVDMRGNIVIPMEYDHISRTADSTHFWVEKDKKIGLYRKNGQIVFPPQLGLPDHLQDFNSGILRKDGLFGFFDAKTETWTIPPKYVILRPADYPGNEAKLFEAILPGGKRGIIGKAGNEIIPLEFDSLRTIYSENPYRRMVYTIATKGNKTGVFDSARKLIIPFKFDKIYIGSFEFKESQGFVFFPVKGEKERFYDDSKGAKIGLYDGSGKMLLHIAYDFMSWMGDSGYLLITKKNSVYYYNFKKRSFSRRAPVIPETIDGKTFAIKITKYGTCLVDRRGKLILLPSLEVNIYDSFYSYRSRDERIVLRKYNGDTLKIGPAFKEEWPSDDGYTYVKTRSNNLGVIDKLRKIIVDTLFYEIRERTPIPEDEPGFWAHRYYILDSLKGRKLSANQSEYFDYWKYISKDGNYSSPWLDNSSYFHNGLAIVSAEGKTGLMNEQGKLAVPMLYRHLMRDSFGLYFFEMGKQSGLLNNIGQVIVSGIWDDYLGFKNGYAVYIEKGVPGLIDSTGSILFDAAKNELNMKQIDLEHYFPFYTERRGKADTLMPWDSVIIGFASLRKVGNMELVRKLRNELIVLSLKRETYFTSNDEDEDHAYLEALYDTSRWYYSQPVSSNTGKDLKIDTDMFKARLAYLNKYSVGLGTEILNKKTGQATLHHIYNYEIRNNNLIPLKLKNLFDTTKTWVKVLNNLLLDKMRDWDEPEQSCILNVQRLLASDNMFAILPEGLLFSFEKENNRYKTKPNENHFREILIPYASLKAIANPKSPISEFIH